MLHDKKIAQSEPYPLGAPGRPQQDDKRLHQTDDSNHAEADNPDLTKLASFWLKKKN
jgi:hypothetical protein